MEKTKEDFNKWNKEKQFIEFFKKKTKIVKLWDIWITKVWINIWSEISKDWEFSRPVLVISNFLWWDLIWIIPFTTQYNSNYDKYLLEFKEYKKYWLNKKSYLVLNQFKIISIKRLERKINNKWYKNKFIPLVNNQILDNIKEKLVNFVIQKKNL
jgi:hypothetical protein